jgi:hypothetical protein
MISDWTYTLLSVVMVSAISLIGIATISLSDRIVKQTIFVSVSLAAGAMFGDVFHLHSAGIVRRASAKALGCDICSDRHSYLLYS